MPAFFNPGALLAREQNIRRERETDRVGVKQEQKMEAKPGGALKKRKQSQK